ncbi:MAG: TolC family protein [Rariglobus sp.]
MKSSIAGPVPLRLLKTTGLTALAAAMLTSGCTRSGRYKEPPSYRSEFRQMIRDYQTESNRLATADRTFQANPTGTPATITLQGDPISSGARVQADIPSKETSLEALYVSAIQHSSQIKVFSDLPLIRETSIQEAEGAFDVNFFVEGRYDELNDPVGSTLTTGGSSRYEEEKLGFRTGVRKKVAATGAEVYVTQELSRTENNSVFFQPNPQTNARLVVGAVQPLLNGAGVGYNRSIIQIAEIDSEIARHEFLRQIESHLLEITRTYWGLYLARGVYQAKSRAFDDASKTVSDLESRSDFDAVRQQVLRARAATAERRADLVRSESAVRNAEDRLKALINDPAYKEVSALEIIPTDLPVLDRTTSDLEKAATAALENRPEIQQAFLQLKAAAIRRDMSRNELMPVLNLLVEGYVGSIRRNDWNGTFNDEFDARPGYTVGLRLDYPLGNNQAEARNMRRRLEARQLVSQLRTTLETVLLEVKVAVREVQTAYRDMSAKHESMVASRADLDSFQKRREAMFLGGDTTAISYIEFLIESQNRRASAEEGFLQAVATYNVALVSLERVKGSLLSYESINTKRNTVRDADALRSAGEYRDVPELTLVRTPPAPATTEPVVVEPIAATPATATTN